METEIYSAPEREAMLSQMSDASNAFYAAAVKISCHPFIEFTGLMNEYIKCCADAHNKGIDFTNCSAHSGNHLPMESYQIAYVNEKLECIFTGRSVVAVDN
jgi:hypothetical protein